MSLRFVPTLMDDTTRIMNAQRARGVDFNEGKSDSKVKSVIPILIPLFASSFKRADALATAMSAWLSRRRRKNQIPSFRMEIPRYLCCYCHDITRCNTLYTKKCLKYYPFHHKATLL